MESVEHLPDARDPWPVQLGSVQLLIESWEVRDRSEMGLCTAAAVAKRSHNARWLDRPRLPVVVVAGL